MRTHLLALSIGAMWLLSCGAKPVSGLTPEEPPSSDTSLLTVGTNSLALVPGETLQLTPSVTSSTSGLVLSTVSYSSSNQAVATVTASGLVSAQADGTTTVVVTATMLPDGTVARASLQVVVASASTRPALTLSGLPSSPTTVTSASITWTVTGNATVHCRRDGYAPVICPSPFVLGTSTPLLVGTHRVDFFLDEGAGFDVANPARTHAWTIGASGAGGGTAGGGTAGGGTAGGIATAGGSSGGGMAAGVLPLVLLDNIEWGESGSIFHDEDYTSSDVYFRNSSLVNASRFDAQGRKRFGPEAYPGAPVGTTDWNLHRIIRGDMHAPQSSDGYRNEESYYTTTALKTYDGTPATDWWMAFGTYVPSSGFPTNGALRDQTDRGSVFQIHQRSDVGDDGSSGPMFAFELRPELSQNPSWGGEGAKYFISSATAAGRIAPTNVVTYHAIGDILFDAPWGHIVHLRKHSNANAGLLEIWEQRGRGAPWVKIVSYSGPIGFENANDNDWVKTGYYWWTMQQVSQFTDRTVWTKRLRLASAARGGSLEAAKAAFP